MRLNRFLSAGGYCSRRAGDDLIAAGRVTVNGAVVTSPGLQVDPARDVVVVEGTQVVQPEAKRWYLLNKPAGVLSTRRDTHGRRTVYDLLGPETAGVFSVGRLDFDTTGVLLFTDDGDLAHRLTHPSTEVEKVYRAEVRGRVDAGDVRCAAAGIMLEDGPASPAVLRIITATDDRSEVEMVVHEGRKRQVRRMLAALGHPVRTLERLSFAGITAAGLPQGRYRPLEPGEIERLRRAAAKTMEEE